MSKSQVILNTYPADEALRVGDFSLLPTNPKPPIITSHPIRNFIQLTHTSSGEFKTIIPSFNTFTVAQGTSVGWSMYVIDPSNINNPNDPSNLTFIWKKNDSPIYELNRLNNGKGTPQVLLDALSVDAGVSGEYVCEVSNGYGTTSTTPFVLDVINTDNHKMLFTNLVANGDGDGGLDGWIDVNGAFRTQIINKDESVGLDPTTFEFAVTTGSAEIKSYPFTFNAFSQKNLFYPTYFKLQRAQPTITDLTTELVVNENGTPLGLADWEWWQHITAQPSVIANEDLNNPKSPQGFFPGPAWIDQYNNNNSAATQGSYYTLTDELDFEKRNLPYFTRNVINFGDNASVLLQQSINITNAAPLVDRQVAGIDSMRGSFFAYVGLGISRYEVRYTEKGLGRRVNWFVTDLVNYRRYLSSDTGDLRIKPDEGSAIEIVPIADDSTQIKLESFDSTGRLVEARQLTTPTIQDLWAVKEKVFFPLTLYPLYAFFEPNNNPITVFGEQYTSTEAVKALFDVVEGKSAMDLQNLDQTSFKLLDRNAAFFLRRYGKSFHRYGRLYPDQVWEPIVNTFGDVFYENIMEGQDSKRFKALVDPGASAFFGVGDTFDIQPGTRTINLSITMTNNSPALVDSDPRGKGWQKDEIYNAVFNLGSINPITKAVSERSYPLQTYRNPRCGITKIKFQLIPSTSDRSDKHTTYAMPPSFATVLGSALNNPNATNNNTATPGTFYYQLITAGNLNNAPQIVFSEKQKDDSTKNYESVVKGPGTNQPGSQPPAEAKVSSLQPTSSLSK